MKNKEIIESYKMATARYDANAYQERILTKIVEQLQRYLAGTKNVSKSLPIIFEENVTVTFSISDFKDENGNIHYSRIIDAIRGLSDKHFEYKFVDDRNRRHWVRQNFLNSANMIFEDGIVTVELNSGFLNCVFDFSEGFRKFEYIYPFRLSSYYSMRMYKLVSKCRTPITYSISDFKKMLSIDTLKSYNDQSNFNRFVKRISDDLTESGVPFTFEHETDFKNGKIKITPMMNSNSEFDEEIAKRNSDVLKARRDLGEDVFDLLRENGFTRTVIANNKEMLEYLRMRIGDSILDKIKKLVAQYQGNPRFKTLIMNKLRRIEVTERKKEKR